MHAEKNYHQDKDFVLAVQIKKMLKVVLKHSIPWSKEDDKKMP